MTTTQVKIIDCLQRRAKANVLLGKIRTATKDYAEAIQEGKKLLSSSSNATSSADNDEVDATKNLLSNLYLERGHAYEQIEKYANAVDDYKRALKIGGNDTKVSMALARVKVTFSKRHRTQRHRKEETEK